MSAAVDELFEHCVRQAAFDFLNDAQRTFGDVLTAKVLQRGIELEGRRIPIFDLYRWSWRGSPPCTGPPKPSAVA